MIEKRSTVIVSPFSIQAKMKAMKPEYKQLTIEQRYQIAALKEIGASNKEIAQKVKTSESTISREIQRNSGKFGYRAKQAQIKADKRKQQAAKAIKMTATAIALIEGYIRFELSPEQASETLALKHSVFISHERIYQHVWADKRKGGDLWKHLRQAHKKHRKKYGSKDKRGQISNRVSIEQRPDIVDKKSRIGDWEIDTVIGKNHQGVLVTIVERKSKFTLIKKVDSKHADVVTQATIELLKPYSGKEFAGHETISQTLGVEVYFAHPYSSWERGLNENTNGLIRQYFPKGTSFEGITDEQVAFVMHRLNNRPRKGLGYRTPHEVFFEESGLKAAWLLKLHLWVEFAILPL